MKGLLIEFVFSAVLFSVIWGCGMWLWQWKKRNITRQRAVFLSVVSGLIYAVAQLILTHWV